MKENANNTAHWVLGIALVIIGIFIIAAIVLVNSQATGSQVTITNSLPTLEDVYIDNSAYAGVADDIGDYTLGNNQAGLTLQAGTGKTFNVNGTIQDLNGNVNLAANPVELYLYREGQTCGGPGDTTDNYCYNVAPSSCATRDNGNGDQKEFNCPVTVQYHADSTKTGGIDDAGKWVIGIKMYDSVGNITDATNVVEMGTLTAANLGGTIDFGSLALGASNTAANDFEQVIQNTGNDVIDIDVRSDAAMSCDIGTIPVGNIKRHSVSEDHGTGGTALTGSDLGTGLTLGYPQDGAVPLNDSIFWTVLIPSNAVSGTCTGTIEQTIVSI